MNERALIVSAHVVDELHAITAGGGVAILRVEPSQKFREFSQNLGDSRDGDRDRET